MVPAEHVGESLAGERAPSPAGRRVAFVSHRDRSLYRFRLPIMQRLVADDATVFAICPSGDVADRFAGHGIEHVELPIDRLTFNPVRAWASIRRLGGVLGELEPQIVHSFTLRPNLYVNLATRGMRGIVVNSVTGLGSLYTKGGGLRRVLIRSLVNGAMRISTRLRADAVVFQNPDDRAYFIEHRICRTARTRVIAGSGVDASVFSPARFGSVERLAQREAWGIGPGDVVVTMIARLVSAKGVREFYRAAAALKGKATFVLIGERDSGNPDCLTQTEIEHGALSSGVILTGYRADIAEWLHASDIYVLPSYREGLPRTVLEAMAMELPIVTTDAPGCRETVLEGRNGRLVRPGNVASLVRAVSELIENPAARARMGKHSREIVLERFEVRSVVDQHLALYEQLEGSRAQDASREGTRTQEHEARGSERNRAWPRCVSRGIDLVVSFGALLLLALPFIIIGLAIKLDSSGHVFFRQHRVGLRGRVFRVWKFRTMATGSADKGLGRHVSRSDARITRVGRRLREWGVDELPQLINVLRGEMSLVGPRPVLPAHVAQYTDRQRRRLEMKPGITGWALVHGRNSLPWRQRIELDVWYIEHWSLRLDLWILLRTLWVVLVKREGVYGEGGLEL